MKKNIFILFIVLMIAGCASCKSNDGIETEFSSKNETQYETNQVSVVLTGEINYKIIRPEYSDEETIAISSSLWRSILGITGKSVIGISDDFVKNANEANNNNPEILLGLTNRPETQQAFESLPSYMDFSITVKENKIIIYANDTARLKEAAEYFLGKLSYVDGVLTYSNDNIYVDAYNGYEYKNLTLCNTDVSEYVIILPVDAGKVEKDFAEKLSVKIAVLSGVKPRIRDDDNSPFKNEILVGKTNRTVSRDFADGTVEFKQSEYSIRTYSGGVVLAAGTATGYNLIMKKVEQLIREGNGSLASGIDEHYLSSALSLDGRNVMFIGNSFTYYGECVFKSTSNAVDRGYFYQVAKTFGDNVNVINFTYGGASLRYEKDGGLAEPCLYNDMTSLHPNYYNNIGGYAMDPFYDQDYVILQQSGSNIATTYKDAKAIMALFPPHTSFCFYITTHDISSSHTYTIKTAEKLRDEEGVKYIPLGHMVYNLWTGTEKIAGSDLAYIKNSFIVRKTSSDGYHPNYLTGYLTALMTYCAITGNTAVGVEYNFVNTEKTHYTYENATSNFDKILESAEDMSAIQALIDSYISKYNP